MPALRDVHCDANTDPEPSGVFRQLPRVGGVIGVHVQAVFTILIADRNPRVRGFLERELSREGYRIRLAQSAHELLQWDHDRDPVDLVILDPDLPDAVDSLLVSTLRKRLPSQIPVIVHAHPPQGQPDPGPWTPFVLVEKGGNSVERLQQVAADLLKQVRTVPANARKATPSGFR
jgi:CheY-like chemotaxis protein